MKITNLLVATALTAALSTPVYAQVNSDDDIADGLRNVIIVTATRRAENLQDVPLAVTAVGTEELDRQGITDIRGLSNVSPSFNMNSSDTETGGTTLRIRGVGTTGNNVGLESAVGVFLDGVYLSRPGAALGDLVDVERVEILRGPQGTLFGRNTSAGALNITTKRPDLNEFEGFANASYGNFDYMNVQGGVSVPLVQDTLGVRFTGAYRQRDGFLTQGPVGNRNDVNDTDRYSLRGQIYWEPSSDFSIRLIADFSHSDAACCEAVQLTETVLFASGGAFLANGLPANGGAPFVGRETQNNRTGNSTSNWRNGYDNLGLSGEINWQISDDTSLTYIGSYRDFDSFSSRSTDYVDLAIFSVGSGDSIFDGGGDNSGPIGTWTHELRLQGEAMNGGLSWLVGAYYADEQIDTDRGVLGLGADYEPFFDSFLLAIGFPGSDTLAALATGGAVTNIDFTGAFANNRVRQDAQSWSIFTHNTIEITDTLSFTFGLRYTDDHKEGSLSQRGAQNDACITLLPVLGTTGLNGLSCFVFAVPLDLPQAFDNPFTAAVGDGLPLPRSFGNGAQGGIYDEFNDDELIYTVKLQWEPTRDIDTYASFTHGYKSGGYNLDASASVNGADPRFDSETIDAFEIGVKTTLLDGRGTLNIALFHQELSDFQVLEFTGVAFTTFNVPSATSTGFEAEFQAQLSDIISTSIGVTFTDARYPGNCVDGIGAVDPTVLQSASALCGNSLTNAPDFVGNFGLVASDQINDAGWSFTASGNVRFETSRRTSTQAVEVSNTAIPLPFAVQGSNFKVNARIGISSPDERFTFEIWGNNIFDEQTRNVTFNTPLRGITGSRARSAFLEDPATYGITLRTRF